MEYFFANTQEEKQWIHDSLGDFNHWEIIKSGVSGDRGLASLYLIYEIKSTSLKIAKLPMRDKNEPRHPSIACNPSRRSLGRDGVSFYPLASDVSFKVATR